MIILIEGASYTGKTLLAQKMLEKYKYPYLSIDHLKMGMIRSGNTVLTPEDDDDLITGDQKDFTGTFEKSDGTEKVTITLVNDKKLTFVFRMRVGVYVINFNC